MADKLQAVRRIVRGYGSALVCFSGGVDSSLVLSLALEQLGERCFALTTVSALMARAERDDARRLAVELGIGDRFVEVESRELARPGFAENPPDRCYHCKAAMLDLAQAEADRHGLTVILLGTNADELGDYRPGLKAAQERPQVRQPLAEAGVTKAEVRELSRELGLRTWDKPQLACLASRFPYGTAITVERLARVDQFEEGLRGLGFRQLRVRFHDTVARLELEPDDLLRAIEPAMRVQLDALGRELGFLYVAVDVRGFRSGSLNDALGSHGRS